MTDVPRRETRVSADAVCTDDDGRLLLCRFAPGYTTDLEGMWTLPGGGLDHGEDPRVGALRELAEETGLIGEVVELLEVTSGHRVITDQAGEEIDYHGIRILYRCRIVGGKLRDELDGSTDAARWFAADDLAGIPIVDIAELAARRLGMIGA